MKNQEMIERYIYAVTQGLPSNKRQDLGRELAAVIEDSLSEKGAAAINDPESLREVLLGLGDPKLLAARYRGEEAQVLIGQPNYRQYLWILRIVLLATAGGMLLAHGLTAFIEPPAQWGSFVLGALLALINGLVMAFGITTLIFAILYRKQVRFDMDYLDNLPEIPQEEARREQPWELALGIVFFMLFIVAFALLPQLNLPFLAAGRWIGMLDGAVVSRLAPLALAAGVLNLSSLVVNFAAGRDARGAGLLDLLANLVNGLYAFSLLSRPEVLNPAFAQALQGTSGLGSPELDSALLWIPRTVLAVIILVLLFDSGQTVYRMFKAKKR